MKTVLAALGLLGTILLANWVTTEYGMVPILFGLTATAGTYLAGLAFVLRDTLQDAGGRWATVAVIAAGGALSYLISDPFIALASAVAFTASELSDMAVYTPLRKRGYIRAATASNAVGAVVDTLLFLSISGFGISGNFTGQIVGKLTVTGVVVAGVVAIRAVRHGHRRAVTA